MERCLAVDDSVAVVVDSVAAGLALGVVGARVDRRVGVVAVALRHANAVAVSVDATAAAATAEDRGDAAVVRGERAVDGRVRGGVADVAHVEAAAAGKLADDLALAVDDRRAAAATLGRAEDVAA